MSSITDFFILILIVLYLGHGWHVGLFRSLITPLSVLVCSVIGILNYDLDENIVTALLIVLIGTLILSTVLRALVFIGRRSVQQEYRSYVFWGSRLAGSLASVLWKGAVTVVILLIILVLPGDTSDLRDLQNNILQSKTYAYINTYVLDQAPVIKNVFMTLSVFKDPLRSKQLSEIKEFDQFFSSPKVQNLIHDKDLEEEIKGRDIHRIISNPQLKAVLQDERLMQTLTRISRRLYEETMRLNSAGTPPSAP